MKQLAKIALLPVLVLGISSTAIAQKKPAAKKPVAAKPAKAGGFKRLPGGVDFKVVKAGTGTRKPVIGDHIEMYIHVHIGDSVLFDSRKMYSATKPVSFVIAAPRGGGDPMEGFMSMVVGDSAMMKVPVDSMKKNGAQLMPWMKEGMKVEYNVVMVSIRSEAEEKKYNDERAAVQKNIDDAILQDYFRKNGITAKKTASGLYYTTTSEGSGPEVAAGQKVSVNYTGMFMDGNKFDSNTDTAFHHVQPFELTVGKGMVIKGWDEGLQLLKKGAKARFYIPSTMAYGPQEQRGIPANSILIFDVEVTNVQDVVDQTKADDKALKDYFAKNNLTPVKTSSGMYYVITQKGLGETAKAGKKVTMNYTGRLLDGTAFDSNMDPKFNHVSPFSFTLGVGQVIKGWDEGVQLLNIGSKATFFIPSGLAYGDRGAGGAIPPNSPLIFDVELVSIDK
ncbi:MAG: FKBP-type peptidyl-prolyl cis-trans isomerase [Bacteroidota bacterium]